LHLERFELTTITSAQTIADVLYSSGTRYVFGHPGGEVVDLIEALEQCGVNFVLTGHESAAAFMAGAIGRLSGRPGVCLATLGPGACNLVLGVGCAYLDRDPLLAFSARTATDRIRRSPKQNLPLNEVFAPVTKWSVALDGRGTAQTLQAAMDLTCAPPRGPVYLTLPSDVAVGPERLGDPGLQPPQAPAPDERDFEKIAAAVNAARRPIGVIGPALDPGQDTAAVRRFFAETGIPYTVMPQAKGVADEDGEGFVGVVAHGAGDGHIVEWLLQSDCLLGVGFEPVESAHDWHFRAPVYSVANWSVAFDQYRPEAECTGDVTALLGRLRETYRGQAEWTLKDAQALKRRVFEAMNSPAESGPAGLSPNHLMRVIREAVPDEAVVTTDVGAHKMLISQAWRTTVPRTFLVSNGLSAMGYGVPAAMAAALLSPGRPALAVVGDGGFAMMVQELETARRMGIAPLFVVLCDRSLAIIKVAQSTRHIPFRGVDFLPVEWARVAEGFGAHGVTAGTLAGVERAVSEWLARPQLTVLAVPVDEALYAGLTY
jgi:acetolactate synthase-1/2/3 large subunit